ncbi:MAG: hypothetical protein ABI441_05375 [Flavobacterium sp.]
MNSKKILFPIFFVGILFSGCVEKGEMRCILSETTISSNSPIISGDDIILETPILEGATYHWTGPNGFESNLQNPVISKSTVNMSGDYKLVTSIGICKTEELSTNVSVVKNIATCSIANYRLEFVNASFPSQSLIPHYTDGGPIINNVFEISTGSSNISLDILFKGNDIPETGNYTIVNSSTDLTKNTVHVKFNYQYILYYEALSGDVSVSFSNGKFVVTFCDVPFDNIKSINKTGSFTASSKFTEY